MRLISTFSPAGMERRPKPAVRGRRLWWKVHQWAGLKLSILLGFIFLTGTLATVSVEIDWLIHPEMRVDPASAKGEIAWPDIAANIARAYPEFEIEAIAAPEQSYLAARATVVGPDGMRRFVYAHPISGQVQGDTSWVNAERVLRNMHRHLNLPIVWGLTIVGLTGVLLMVSFATALVVYKKWWRGFFKPIRRTNARTGWGDFHRLAGVWSLWFVLVIGLTSIWYLAELWGASAPLHPEPAMPEAAAVQSTDLAEGLSAGLGTVRAHWPELELRNIRFPVGNMPAFQFEGQGDAWLVRDRSNRVWTDAATGDLLLIANGRDLGIHQRISEMADPLHFGDFGGLPTRLVWFLFGLLMTGLAVSGATIYGLRIVHREGEDQGGSLVRYWRGMGIWRWASLAAVIASLVLLTGLIAFA